VKFFDFNIHLPNEAQDSEGKPRYSETETSCESLNENFDRAKPFLAKNLQGAQFVFLNPALLEQPEKLKKTIARIKNIVPESRFSLTPEFRSIDSLDVAVEAEIDGLKFHSYLQQIRESDFEAVLRLCKSAAERKMPLSFCTSYGTSLMYDCDNLKLAAYIAQHVAKTPIILLHSGGRRVLDAMLLADSCGNVFLESSFTAQYYRGGPVYEEILFAFRKLGPSKIVHGSDYPYVSVEAAVSLTMELCDKAGFSEKEKDLVFWDNARSLFTPDRG